MSAKPTPPCVRALDADGSEFFMDARGLAWRADSSRLPELDGPGALGEDRSRCDTCGCRSLSVYGVQAVYGVRRCAACYDALRDAPASAPTPAPLDRAKVVRALYLEWLLADTESERLRGKPRARDMWIARRSQVRSVVYALGLSAEFDAACKEVHHA